MPLGLRPWLSLTIILSFSLLLIKSSLAAQITAEPAQGPAGMIVTVRGTEWTPGNLIEFSWNFNYDLTVAHIIADKNGAFTVPIRVPSGAPQVLTYIDAGDQAEFLSAQAPFTINSSFTSSDDYPEPLCPPNPTTASGQDAWNSPNNEFVDQWNFYNRECVSFVTWRLNQNNGFPAAFDNNCLGAHFGIAYQWVHPDQSRPIPDVTSAVAQLKIPYDDTPLPGDVAWFDTRHAGALDNGHVAWVRSVNPSTPGTPVTIEEYNFYKPGHYELRTLSTTDVSQLKFIHFSDWFNAQLQSKPNRQPPSILTHPTDPESTFVEGDLVYFRIFFTDPDNDAIGFGFGGIKGSGWAEETHPFAMPSYGQLVAAGTHPDDCLTPKTPARIAIQYPFNHLCGSTKDAYESDVTVWIYDRDGNRSDGNGSTEFPIHLACSASGTPHFRAPCTR